MPLGSKDTANRAATLLRRTRGELAAWLDRAADGNGERAVKEILDEIAALLHKIDILLEKLPWSRLQLKLARIALDGFRAVLGSLD